MKIKHAHYETLCSLLLEVSIDRADAVLRHFEQIDREYGTDTAGAAVRKRWDLFWAIRATERTSLMDEIYEYANDSHIDTALRAAIRRETICDLFN